MARLLGIATAVIVACGGSGSSGGGGSSSGGGGAPPAAVETRSREVVNLRAFARLYGVVRWFHPSDEADELDWNAFAAHGVSVVRGASDRTELAARLAQLVAPIGPSIVIAPAAELAKRPVPPPPGGDVEWVAWQHSGPGFDGGIAGTFESKRTSRRGWAGGGDADWGAFSQKLDARPLRGKQVRLRAEMRAGPATRVGAWLRVDVAKSKRGFFDNMMDRPVTTDAWQRGEIVGQVERDAEHVYVGGLVMGNLGFFDAFVLEVADGAGGWKPVPLTNASFEQAHDGWVPGIGNGSGGRFDLTTEPRAGGAGAGAVVRVQAPRTPLFDDLFDDRPAPGETVTVPLGDGLAARVPISLPSVARQTLPAGDRAAAATALASPVTDADRATADVIVLWNVLAHFSPYLDVVKVDWDAQLDDALAAPPGADTLRALLVAAEDGQSRLLPDDARAPLGLALDLVEDRLVVVASGDPAVKPGDEVVSIDGVGAAAALDVERARHAGAPHRRTHAALGTVGAGAANVPARVVLRRDGAVSTVEVRRGVKPPLATYAPIAEVEPGFWRVDLSRLRGSELADHLDRLAAARCIVIDVRERPASPPGLISHLLDEDEKSRWMHIPQLVRPALPGQPRTGVVWTSVGWDLQPMAPRFTGEVVFVAGPGTIGDAESVMGYVEALGLPIVGAATAGANGDKRTVSLPSGAAVELTGTKVTRHDGRRFHGEGVRPTLPVARTLAGVKAGRDEVLERARCE